MLKGTKIVRPKRFFFPFGSLTAL